MGKLPVWSTALNSVRSALAFARDRPMLCAALWVLQFATDELSAMTGPSEDPPSFDWNSGFDLARAVLASPIFLALYRHVLIDDRAATYDVASPRGRKFIAANVIFEICVMTIPGGVFAALYGYRGVEAATTPTWVVAGMVVDVLLMLAAGYWAIRASLLFPLIAIDRPSPISRSLVLTRGRVWRISCIAGLPAVAAGGVELLVTGVQALPGVDRVPQYLVDFLVSGVMAFMAISVAGGVALIYLWTRDVTRAPSPDAIPTRS